MKLMICLKSNWKSEKIGPLTLFLHFTFVSALPFIKVFHLLKSFCVSNIIKYNIKFVLLEHKIKFVFSCNRVCIHQNSYFLGAH